ncbi:DUF6308 family protein [Promicromonospora sukumoe]|uniref:DUF6308 family protein n=1 Tax=Promicromonospora sukumoe TaxID=88382 RepID=UPI0037C90131
MSTEMKIAGRAIESPFTELAAYGLKHDGTVARYDLAGASETMTLGSDEIARTRIIKSRISRAQSDWFVDRSTSAPWEDVPSAANLADADPEDDGGLYAAANALYEHFRSAAPTRVADGKIHKVLHLKRPGLVPILDSRLRRTYSTRAVQAARRHPQLGARRLYWAAIREDLIDEGNMAALEEARGELSAHVDPKVQAMARLTDLRLLDAVAWRAG